MATREQKQNKQIVEKILLIKGIKYDNWLDEIHKEYLQNNILDALNIKLGDEKKEAKKEEKEEKESKQSFDHSNVNQSNVNHSNKN